MAKFKTGDVVKLNSGGPAMTVDGYQTEGGAETSKVLCTWFAGEKVERTLFSEELLKPVSQTPPGVLVTSKRG
jgi:uncharacterized protein YodC (DUF2158 family)